MANKKLAALPGATPSKRDSVPENIPFFPLMATPSPSFSIRTPLTDRLAAVIATDGPMSFEVFMERCLYDPDHGYYAAPERMVGRQGDFHTSVSVGPVFGELIAAWVAREWTDMGCPPELALIEQGAHDGQLMIDVLAALAVHHPYLATMVRPIVIEPSAGRRAAQQQKLGARVSWWSSLDEAADAPLPWALFFANELLDAFPVARWRFDGRAWQQLAVALDIDQALCWDEVPAPDFRLPGICGPHEAMLPTGYVTETCPGLGPWVQSLGRSFTRGRALLFDYGREAADYFAPHRSAGTLRGYRAHRRCDDPLAAPGETDLTADVNFTHLAEEAIHAGFVVRPAERQGTFLTRLATARLVSPPQPEAAWLRQFQTLIHPNQLGHSFHAMVLEKNSLPEHPAMTCGGQTRQIR